MVAATVDEYLAGVPGDKRVALDRLRSQIKAAAPDATESISYGLPTFKLDGRWFVAFGVAKNHCSFYPGAAPPTDCGRGRSISRRIGRSRWITSRGARREAHRGAHRGASGAAK